ncbi:MAG: gliding motility-associated C-terminal domain-containing protein [Hymenobacteraceae bacterium]|nr:gliding motility-associated C-terminal domain-containing protein [Hymenobacteraceae bacterium]
MATLLCLLGTVPAGAPHIVGGQLRMTYQRPGVYRLGLTLYFDDIRGAPGALDSSIVLAVYGKGNTADLMDTFKLPLRNRQLVADSDPMCQLDTLRTSQLSYQREVTLNPERYTSPNGYYMVWERCCRNGIIRNIVRPGDMGQTFYLEFPALRRNGQPFINSSPAAFEPVRDPACVNVSLRTPFGGIDPDGDSLVYALVTPLRGHSDTLPALRQPQPPRPAPYRRIEWITPGFDSLNQIAGPQPLVIDSRTGELTFTASAPGLYVFAVRCTEYRNGVRLGEVRREFQELVVRCQFNEPPALTLTQLGLPGQALPYVPGTVLQLPSPPATRCLNLYAVDQENNSRLSFQVVAPGAAPGTVLPTLSVTDGTVNPGGRRDTLVARLCFDECFGRDGTPLQLALIVTDHACPTAQRDTAWLTVQSPFVLDTPPTIAFVDGATAAGYTVRGGEQVVFDFIGVDVDSGSRVSVRGVDLTSGRLAGLGVICPRRTAEGTATTRLTWEVPCATPPGDYTLRLQAEGEVCGRARAVDTVVRVTVLPPDTSRVIPPNVITPNGDDLNDEFQPAVGIKPACGAEFRQLRIFSRWGQQVFSSPDRRAIWRAEHAAGGIYFYFLEYSDRTYKGWVEVIR